MVNVLTVILFLNTFKKKVINYHLNVLIVKKDIQENLIKN